MSSHGPCIFQDARPRVVDFPLTLIFSIWQWVYHWPFGYNADQYIHFGTIGQCSPLIAECVRLKIIDNLLMPILITSKQHLYTQYLYATNHIHIIDIQYCIVMYYRFHPRVLLPFNFCSTAIHPIWVRDNVALSHSCTFGRQFMACGSFH